MVWWNAVSKTATCWTGGTASEKCARAALYASRLCGLWRGARLHNDSISFSISASMMTDSYNLSPPCTMRCPTASMVASPSCSNADFRASAKLDMRSTSPLWSNRSGSMSNKSNLRDELPALRTSIFTDLYLFSNSGRPSPIANLGHIFAVRTNIARMIGQLAPQILPQVSRYFGKMGHPVDYIYAEMKPIDLIQHAHIERRCRSALFLI